MKNHIEMANAAFLTSAAKLSQCPADVGHEVAFCGRSNAGKSSAINYLTGQHKLARTSKTPGRTQLINFFTLSEQARLVDLPGYGYAKVPTAMRDAWHEAIDIYLRNRRSLAGVVLVMDIRHPLKEFDQMMLDWAYGADLRLHIILTKCDKLKRGAQQAVKFSVEKQLPARMSVQLLSSTHDVGKDELSRVLTAWLSGH